jgi:mycofactocin precursor
MEQATDLLQVQPETPGEPADVELDLVEEELLIEEISIDGMCGVY